MSELTCGIQAIQITEVVTTPLGKTLEHTWSADLSDNSTSDLQKIRDYIGREIAKREAEDLKSIIPNGLLGGSQVYAKGIWSDPACNQIQDGPDKYPVKDIIQRTTAMREAAQEADTPSISIGDDNCCSFYDEPAQELFHLEPTPAAHKYTLAEFERMEFRLYQAKMQGRPAHVNLSAAFDWDRSPQGSAYWESIINDQDAVLAALQDIITQFSELHDV